MSKEEYKCELCGSGVWRVLHAGDESNCECEGECLRVCDNPELEDGCDGVAELVERGRVMHDHNFKATDIPGVCLCKCGVEIYYASEKQAYYVSVEG